MKFTQSVLVALATFSIGEVAAQRGNRGGNNNSGAAATSSSVDTAATSSVAAADGAAATSSTTGTTGTTGGGNNGTTGATGNDSASLTLDQTAIQTGSASAGDANAEAGQSDSATDNANFINFCAGQTLTNGLQVKGGSCNGIPMGNIPSTANMISSVITFPSGQTSDNIDANAPFTIKVQTSNLAAGTFTNPATTYYSAPQDLKGGIIIGHTHVTVQDCSGGLPTAPLDPGTFSFFKGINTPVDQNGELTADVTAGLPAGFYRVCTMTSAANHQPVTMPIAQRGAQDDCRYFSVGGVGEDQTSGSGATGTTGTGSGGAGAGTGGAAATSSAAGSAGTGSTGGTGNDSAATSTASATTGSTTATSGNTSTGRGGRGGRGGKYRGRFMARGYVA